MELENLIKDAYLTIKEEQYIFIVHSFLFNQKIIRQDNLVSEMGHFQLSQYNTVGDFLIGENLLIKNKSLDENQFFYSTYFKQIEENVTNCFYEAIKLYITEYITNDNINDFTQKYNITLPENNFISSNNEGKLNILFILSKNQLMKNTRPLFREIINEIKLAPLKLILEEYTNIVQNRKYTKDFYEKLDKRINSKNTDKDFLELSKIGKLISIEYFLISNIILDIEDLYNPKFFNDGLKFICKSLLDKRILTIFDLENYFSSQKPELLDLFKENFK